MPKLRRREALKNLHLQESNQAIAHHVLTKAYYDYIKKDTSAEGKDKAIKSVAALISTQPTTITAILRLFTKIFFKHETVSETTVNKNRAIDPAKLCDANGHAKINAEFMNRNVYNFAHDLLTIPENPEGHKEWQLQYLLLWAVSKKDLENLFYKQIASHDNEKELHWDVFYQFIYKKINWADLTTDQGISCLAFLHGEDGKKLYGIFEAMHYEIDENKKIKEEVMGLRSEFINKIAKTCSALKAQDKTTAGELMSELNNIVENKIKQKSIILYFLRIIAGILLVICGLMLPLCCPPFRSYFFAPPQSSSQKAHKYLLETIKPLVAPKA